MGVVRREHRGLNFGDNGEGPLGGRTCGRILRRKGMEIGL
jgi:hypothetical protein